MGKITHGLFIYYGQKKFNFRGEEYPILEPKFKVEFRDFKNRIDYRNVIRAIRIDDRMTWTLVFLSDHDDEEVRRDAIIYLEDNLDLLSKIKDLINYTPERIKDINGKEKGWAGKLLDRGGA